MYSHLSAMDDTVAVQSRPVPVMTSPIFPALVDDPDLGLTPEKPALIHNKIHHRNPQCKARQKVRFADHGSPEVKSNKDKVLADEVNENVEIINIEPVHSVENENQLEEDEPLTVRYEATDSVNKYTHMIESGEALSSCIPVPFCDREINFSDRGLSQDGDAEAVESQPPEHALARPEFNSTLWMNKELQQMKSQTLDVAAAVQEKLKVSSTTRQKIAEKAYSKLNHHVVEQQYPELISLELPEDEIVSMAARQQSAKVKAGKKDTAKAAKNVLSEMPDIYDFLTPDRQKETASFSLDGASSARAEFCTAPPLAAFQIYKHIRMWENY